MLLIWKGRQGCENWFAIFKHNFRRIVSLQQILAHLSTDVHFRRLLLLPLLKCLKDGYFFVLAAFSVAHCHPIFEIKLLREESGEITNADSYAGQ